MGLPRAERPLEGLSARDVERMAGEIEAALAAGDVAKADAVLAAATPPTTRYTVVSGDTLSGIAKRSGVALSEY